MTRWFWVCAAAVACGGKDSGDATGTGSGSAAPYMNVLSPTPGEFIDEGDSVTLLAEGRLGNGAAAELSDVAWVSDDGVFAVSGNDVAVTDLHPGAYALQVVGIVAGEGVTAEVDVVVYAAR